MIVFPWDDASDATVLRMRRAGETFAAIGKALGITRNAAQGRYHRLAGTACTQAPRTYASRTRAADRRHRTYDSLTPSKTPFASDDSCPAFAWDDDHCAAVLALRPFPVMPRRAA